MKTINVNLGARSYPILIDRGLLQSIPQLFDVSRKRKWVIVTQRSLHPLFGSRLVRALESSGIVADTIFIPPGEEAKSLSHAESVYHQLVAGNCDRSTMLVALGGGVVGDIAGFVAATYMRGIDYLQVPTTLLAMVDSAIGGKTSVNLAEGKNLVGAFHQPKGVVIDADLLHSLPDRERTSGMAEMLKYGAIQDRRFFTRLDRNMKSLFLRENQTFLTNAIARCCRIKADVISRDERETDLRRILNFGHTVGHALETSVGYGVLTHGEAVAYGMIAAGRISCSLGHLNREDLNLLESAVRKLSLPELVKIDPATVLTIIRHDKKVKDGKVHFVLLHGLGNAIISNGVKDNDVRRALESL